MAEDRVLRIATAGVVVEVVFSPAAERSAVLDANRTGSSREGLDVREFDSHVGKPDDPMQTEGVEM